MPDELFSVASDFFFLGIIPSIIGMIWILRDCIKSKRYPVIVSIILSLLGAIGIFAIACFAIYIFIALITIAATIGFGIAMIIGLIFLLLDGDI